MAESKKSDSKSETGLEFHKIVEIALRKAVRNALIEHKRAGNTVVEWRDGKINFIKAEDIVIPEEPAE